jgi:hypothetical protein
VGDMTADIKSDRIESVDEILERIRTRLAEQVKFGFASGSGSSYRNGGVPVSTTHLRLLLEEIRSLHSQVGAVNPRPAGPINDAIQLFKRVLRRILRWYTRPIVRYQATTTQFLDEVTETLERDQSKLRSLEAKVGLLADEFADLRQRTLARLEWIVEELAKRGREGS